MWCFLPLWRISDANLPLLLLQYTPVKREAIFTARAPSTLRFRFRPTLEVFFLHSLPSRLKLLAVAAPRRLLALGSQALAASTSSSKVPMWCFLPSCVISDFHFPLAFALTPTYSSKREKIFWPREKCSAYGRGSLSTSGGTLLLARTAV